MGVWAGGAGEPHRDSAFDSTVLLHEYMHGVTVRLVGGPAASGCLGGNDGLSLNEGYSDFVPTLLRVKAGDTRSRDYAHCGLGRGPGGRAEAALYLDQPPDHTPHF